MGQANAYFQFVIKEHATYIKLFPAALEGNVIEIGELTEYLDCLLYTSPSPRD